MTAFQILLTGAGSVNRPIAVRSPAPTEWGWPEYNTTARTEWPTFEDAQAALDVILQQRWTDYVFRIAVKGDFPADMDWRLREKLRFGGDTRKPTPWHSTTWYQAKHGDHFCHLSNAQPGKIAFTENDAKGAADRQLVMSPGRYLNRYFSEHLTNEEIEQWCAKVSVLLQEDELKITQDADEIEEVYLGGPESCMSHPLDSYDSPVHPVRVYAGPDTALAYLGPRDDAKARSVVWPEKKIYSRLYGDTSRLKLMLENAGYSEGDLHGARIQRILTDDQYVVPYIDRGGDLSDDGEFLVIGGGSIPSKNTEGLSGSAWICPRCGDVEDESDSCYISDVGENWCEHCTANNATYCEYGEEYLSDGNTFVTVHGPHLSEYTVLERRALAFGAVYVEGRGEYWMEREIFGCEDCGEYFLLKDKVDADGDTVCAGCFEDRQPDPIDDTDPDQQNQHVITWRALPQLTLAIAA